MEYIIAPILFMIALGGFWGALKFAKFKQGQSACCGGGASCSHDAQIRAKKCTKAKIDQIKTEIYMN